jgi:hypothetical protein
MEKNETILKPPVSILWATGEGGPGNYAKIKVELSSTQGLV